MLCVHQFCFDMPAEGERSVVKEALEAKRDQLVQNYVQEQQKLYSELIPEVILH